MKQFMSVALAIALIIVSGLALAQDPLDFEPPDDLNPPDAGTVTGTGGSTAGTGGRGGRGGGASKPPKCSPDYGMFRDLEDPANKRCKTEAERNTEILYFVNRHQQASEPAENVLLKAILRLLSTAALLLFVTFLYVRSRKQNTRLRKLYGIAKLNRERLDLAKAPYPEDEED